MKKIFKNFWIKGNQDNQNLPLKEKKVIKYKFYLVCLREKLLELRYLLSFIMKICVQKIMGILRINFDLDMLILLILKSMGSETTEVVVVHLQEKQLQELLQVQ